MNPIRPTLRLLLLAAVLLAASAARAGEKPNVVFILADDLGYGDVYEGGMRVPTFVWRKGGFTKTWRRYDIVKDPHQDNDLAAAPQP